MLPSTPFATLAWIGIPAGSENGDRIVPIGWSEIALITAQPIKRQTRSVSYFGGGEEGGSRSAAGSSSGHAARDSPPGRLALLTVPQTEVRARRHAAVVPGRLGLGVNRAPLVRLPVSDRREETGNARRPQGPVRFGRLAAESFERPGRIM